MPEFSIVSPELQRARHDPEEYDFMIGKVLNLILTRMAQTPNPALH